MVVRPGKSNFGGRYVFPATPDSQGMFSLAKTQPGHIVGYYNHNQNISQHTVSHKKIVRFRQLSVVRDSMAATGLLIYQPAYR